MLDIPDLDLKVTSAPPWAASGGGLESTSNILKVSLQCAPTHNPSRWLKLLEDRGIEVAWSGSDGAGHNDLESVDAVVAIFADEFEALRYCRRTLWRYAGAMIVITPAPTSSGCKRALLAGVDHYLSDSLDPEELVLRIRTHRRRVTQIHATSAVFDAHLTFDGWTLDILSHRIRAPDGGEARLCGLSVRFLLALLRYPREPLSPARLAALTNLEITDSPEHHVRVAIYRLRQELRALDPGTDPIKNVRGLGYTLNSAPRRGD